MGAAAVAICAYVTCLLAFAPATLLDAVADRGSGGRLRIAEAQGTLWTGNGQLEFRDVTRSGGVGRRLSWRFQPQSLLRGQLLFEVDVADAPKSFPLKISLSGIEISDAELAFPAAVLGLAVPSVAVIEPTGDLLIHVSRLSVAGNKLAGNVTVHWQSAGSSLTPVSPLGDYELTMESDSRGVNASLRTLKGPLHLSGKGSSRRESPFAFTVSARVDPQQQAQLTPFLRLIAVERQPGNFELQIAQITGRAPGGGPVRQ
jgi:general secretion pathway protein N